MIKLKKWCKHNEVMRLKTPQGYIYWYAQTVANCNRKIAGKEVGLHADMTKANFCPICGKEKPKQLLEVVTDK